MLNSKLKSCLFSNPGIAVMFLLFLCSLSSQAQTFEVSLSATNASPNNCNARTITATVSGGSGNYTYYWTAQPTTGVNLGDNPSIVVNPTATTVFTSAVEDNNTNQFTTASITLGRVLQGNFSVNIPNSFTPNGDNINDIWLVMDGSSSTGPLNAYSYTLTIKNSSNQTVYSRNQTITSGLEGIQGGDINWNGRLNGSGSIVPNGFYQYALSLINCSGNQNYSGILYVLGGSSLTTLLVYPNPARDYVVIMIPDSILGSELIIQNSNGEVLLRTVPDQIVSEIDLSRFPAGTYFISAVSKDLKLTERLKIDP